LNGARKVRQTDDGWRLPIVVIGAAGQVTTQETTPMPEDEPKDDLPDRMKSIQTPEVKNAAQALTSFCQAYNDALRAGKEASENLELGAAATVDAELQVVDEMFVTFGLAIGVIGQRSA
jgi:hypothetical protein